MKKLYILNAISLQMFSTENVTNLCITPVSTEAARGIVNTTSAEVVSAIGHPDLASVVSSDLGREFPANRISVSLEHGDCALVAQYIGPRLPEGTTRLPEGSEIRYFRVDVVDVHKETMYQGTLPPGTFD